MRLRDTLDAFDQRKLAVLGRPAASVESFEAPEVGLEEMRLLFSGFDADPREAWEEAGKAAVAAIASTETVSEIPLAMRSLWLDGLVAGMLHERRAREAMG